ncbi:Nop52-domain-containing protein [Suillus clintonianus]|uniref:Nop52-domain-containing protein n=1 Tax=Suillus clintonianus TaxID=1904413 RepID=UPI001B8869F2|nr:Nop52-domain-containing protein [Suillus clintonianus]KAG2155550.1 Nop52-domain-containing protein [Suillus clintonianus]
MSAASAPAVPPLGKYLASSDKKTRDKAVKNLAVFLSSDSENVLPDLEMAKLWKGIFYCFWMSDKPLVQQALAGELAELILTITDVPSSLNFLRGFWTMTVREWSGIDRLRMDKYYMLVRKFVNASFRFLVRTKWDSATVEKYNSILSGPNGPLCPNDIRVPASLAFHLSEIYFEELEKALSSSESPPPAPLSTLLSPFIGLAARTPTITTYKHIQSSLFEPLRNSLKSSSNPPSRKKARTSSPDYSKLLANACTSSSDSDPAMDTDAVRKSILQKIFDIASETETRDANRRRMYAFYKDAVDDDDEDSAG